MIVLESLHYKLSVCKWLIEVVAGKTGVKQDNSNRSPQVQRNR